MPALTADLFHNIKKSNHCLHELFSVLIVCVDVGMMILCYRVTVLSTNEKPHESVVWKIVLRFGGY